MHATLSPIYYGEAVGSVVEISSSSSKSKEMFYNQFLLYVRGYTPYLETIHDPD